MLSLPDLAACRANIHLIRSALGDFHNGIGPAVYGRNSSGDWVQLRRARLEKGTPYGEDGDGKVFVLRGVRAG